jgi:hypothetical protein
LFHGNGIIVRYFRPDRGDVREREFRCGYHLYIDDRRVWDGQRRRDRSSRRRATGVELLGHRNDGDGDVLGELRKPNFGDTDGRAQCRITADRLGRGMRGFHDIDMYACRPHRRALGVCNLWNDRACNHSQR